MSSSSRGRKSIILRLVLLAFVILSLINLTSLEIKLIDSKRQLKSGEAILEEKNLEIKELVRLLDSGTEADLIEKSARERLGYVFPDEQVYIDLSGQ